MTQRKPTVALVADSLTSASLVYDAHVVPVGPIDYRWRLRLGRPDFLLVESVWEGPKAKWKYKVASYPDFPSRTNLALARLVAAARDRGIPTVFWNKEDGVHFDRFVESARLFDYVFTVDSSCVPKYREALGNGVPINTMMFAIQPRTHGFQGFNFKYRRAAFVGSYGRHIHERRRYWQDILFGAACGTGLGLTVVDRNSHRKAAHYRFPSLPDLQVLPAMSHAETASVFRDYLVSLNVNTIEDSPTMFSRRLVEIIGCGGIAVTNPSPAVDALFRDYCYQVHDAAEAEDLFARLLSGPSSVDLERARAGAEYVLNHHTWSHRLREIAAVIAG